VRVPRLSIGLPVYNGQNYLRCALDSILQQDYTDFELIISDNASTDATRKICCEYSAIDPRIRYYRNEANIGASSNYNRVFGLAHGEFFKWATHDDVHLPGFLRRCVEVLDQAPSSVVLVAPRVEIIDEKGKKIAKDWKVERLDTRRPRPHQRVADVLRHVAWATAQFGLFRSEALRKTRLIDRFHACDYVLLLEVAILGEIWEIPEILFQRRFHPAISTSADKTQAELLQWFDPSQKPKGRFFPRMKLDLVPRTRLALEYARSIGRMPLPAKERILCFFTAFFYWFSRESRRLVSEYWSRLRGNLKRVRVSLRRHRERACASARYQE
jgi:glycosyltransferase involved in cell wall biosynthesis